MQRIGHISVLVRDYDEAIAYYTTVMGFSLIEDTDLGGGKRWVRVAPRGAKESQLLLAKAKNNEELAAVGRQSGGRVFLFLHCDDFWHDYRELVSHGVKFAEAPRNEGYGTVAVFEDLYGNRWDLLQLKNQPNHPAEPTAASVTAAAGHPPRQP
jgi:catechol 2,3-dioxygenase-like lactoylglutathione lyase family enzyme